MTFEELNKKYGVSRETYEKLCQYVEILVKWNQKINLIGKSTIEDIWERHIADSLGLMPFLKSDKRTADLGTGAGIPGVILSIAGIRSMSLVESDTKKCSFLSFVKAELGLSVDIHNQRVESLQGKKYQQIVCRAFAPLDRLLGYTYPLCDTETICVFMKGRDVQNEIEHSLKTWHFTFKTFPTAQGYILEVQNVRKHVNHENHCSS